jgi:hypothetical protein
MRRSRNGQRYSVKYPKTGLYDPTRSFLQQSSKRKTIAKSPMSIAISQRLLVACKMIPIPRTFKYSNSLKKSQVTPEKIPSHAYRPSTLQTSVLPSDASQGVTDPILCPPRPIERWMYIYVCTSTACTGAARQGDAAQPCPVQHMSISPSDLWDLIFPSDPASLGACLPNTSNPIDQIDSFQPNPTAHPLTRSPAHPHKRISACICIFPSPSLFLPRFPGTGYVLRTSLVFPVIFSGR